jgi:hypothetical protein
MNHVEQPIAIPASDLRVDDVLIQGGGVFGISEPEVVVSVNPVKRADGSTVVYFGTDSMNPEDLSRSFLFGDRVIVVLRQDGDASDN